MFCAAMKELAIAKVTIDKDRSFLAKPAYLLRLSRSG